MKLTRTDVVFSRATSRSDFCARKVKIELSQKIPRKFLKIRRAKRFPQPEGDPKGGHPWPRRPEGTATPWPRPRGARTSGTSPQAPFGLYFYSRDGNPETEVDTP